MSYSHEKVSDLAGNTVNPTPPWALKELGLALTKDLPRSGFEKT